MNKKLSSLILALIVFSGCAVKTTSYSNLRLVTIPEPNKLTTIEVGQTIISKAFVKSTPAIFVPATIVDPMISISLPSGIFPLVNQDMTGKYYENPVKNERSNWEAVPAVFVFKSIERSISGQQIGTTGIFIPSDNASHPVIYTSNGDLKGSGKVEGFQHTQIEEWKDGSFKRELIYTGVSKNVITILYREFLDGLARPAYTQEIKYDLTESKVIGYRGARFEVVRATNTDITYKVLKTLE